MIVQYFANNSGGFNWLNDDEWERLESHGWKTYGFEDFEYVNNRIVEDDYGMPKNLGIDTRKYYAIKRFNSVADAKLEFSLLTGEDPESEGCNCCGQPHEFSIYR